MKNLKIILNALIALWVATQIVLSDTDYPIGDATRAANRGKVEALRAQAYWRDSPLAVCSVEAMSTIKRTPDLFPEDADFTGPLRVVAALGEYEPASFLLYAFNDLPAVSLRANDLTHADGTRLDASAIELKVVKVWYQMGTAWHGFHADHLRRVATPELLLNNEKLIKVDHENRENYLLCQYPDGTSSYRWISFTGDAVNYASEGKLRNEWIRDADSIQPIALQADAFKQILATVFIPPETEPGLYHGALTASIDGHDILDIPIEVRVLPFRLPRPATFRNENREFYASCFLYSNDSRPWSMNPVYARKLARNLAAHNILNPFLPMPHTRRQARDFFETAAATGLDTNIIFKAVPPANLTTSDPPVESDKNYHKYRALAVLASNTVNRIREQAPKADIYSFGIDEARPDTVRAERASWKLMHSLGAKVMTTTHIHPYLLFGLDMALPPIQPGAIRKPLVDSMHSANDDMLIGWYADPHSGPENPGYTRRLYGWDTWRNNYDMICQYILFRDDWLEFFVVKESNLRGLMLVYPQHNNIIDTLAWEGVREALDDIRYATLLRQLARQAIDSGSIENAYLGRAAQAWIAQVDTDHADLKGLRLDIIQRCLHLHNRLEEGGK